MIAIIDYGMGNLRSVQKALETAGAETVITQDIKKITEAEKIVLPGVGAMKPAMEKLRALNLIPVIKKSIEKGKPFLGICLGYQLLFDTSDEGGNIRGLEILRGTVTRFNQLKVPHMGWNQLKFTTQKSPLFLNIAEETNVYFCHSFFVKPADSTIISAQTDYGVAFASAVHSKNIFAVQFHPEKSQAVGLQILKNFINISL